MEWDGEAIGVEGREGSLSPTGPSAAVLGGKDAAVAGGSLTGELVVSSRIAVAL